MRPHKSRPKRKAKKDPLDPQIKRVYAWETDWVDWNTDTLTLAECRVVIRTACRRYHVPIIPVVQHAKTSECDVRLKRIAMQYPSEKRPHRGGKNKSQCLHEAAHWIVYHYYKDRPQDHGPTFVGVYIWLMGAARVAPIEALLATARVHKLRWAHRPPSFFL